MALKIKPAPAQLDTETVETIWPGDSSVDLERSNLIEWCIEGGSRGLALRDDSAQIWELRPLSGRALSIVLTAGPTMEAEAFRFGLVAAPGLTLRTDRFGGVRGLADSAMELIEAAVPRMPLPILAAVDANNGIDRDKVRQDMIETSILDMLGAHVLALSFRKR